MKRTSTKDRIITLDLLRGYFIFVIIIDHLIRWPSPLAWATGQGRLWVSAAEGFFIISGLLVGYTRGFKLRSKPFKDVAKLLLSRALMLYISAVIATALLLVISSRLTFTEQLQPMLTPVGSSLWHQISLIVTQRYVFEWVYFLKLYWIVLFIAPAFIYLLRNENFLYVVALSSILWLIGIKLDFDWLQWQALFFIPSIAGYKLDTIRAWLNNRSPRLRLVIRASVYTVCILTLALSSFWVFGWKFVEDPRTPVSFSGYISTRGWLDPLFAKMPLSPLRALLASVWFSGLFLFVRQFEKFFVKYTGWLLIPFGRYSLTAYLIHGFVIVWVQAFVPISTSSLQNLLVTCFVVALVFLLIRIPIVKRVFPQ